MQEQMPLDTYFNCAGIKLQHCFWGLVEIWVAAAIAGSHPTETLGLSK